MNTRNSQDGFTLLETILAFLILSISMGVAVETISRGGMTFRRAGDLEKASLVLSELAVNQLKGINKAERTDGKGDDGESWTLISNAAGLTNNKPTFAVRISIRPRGESGPVFDYLSFVTNGKTQ